MSNVQGELLIYHTSSWEEFFLCFVCLRLFAKAKTAWERSLQSCGTLIPWDRRRSKILYFSTNFMCHRILQGKRKKLIYKMYFTNRKTYVFFSENYKVSRLNSKRSVEKIYLSREWGGGRRNNDMWSKESPKATGAEPGSLVGRSLRSLQPGPLSPRKGLSPWNTIPPM